MRFKVKLRLNEHDRRLVKYVEAAMFAIEHGGVLIFYSGGAVPTAAIGVGEWYQVSEAPHAA